jgi:hypothetical protein
MGFQTQGSTKAQDQPGKGRPGTSKYISCTALLTMPVTQYQFITFKTPNEQNDKATKRLARSHAVKQALQNKRRIQQAFMQNFCIRTIEDESKPMRAVRKSRQAGHSAPSPLSLSGNVLDPFRTLAVDSKRLQILLNNCKSLSARHYSIQVDMVD